MSAKRIAVIIIAVIAAAALSTAATAVFEDVGFWPSLPLVLLGVAIVTIAVKGWPGARRRRVRGQHQKS